MCGRFALDTEPDVIKTKFNVSVLPELKPNYNACPTEPILFLTPTEGGELRGEIFRWGLIPFFSKEWPKTKPLINARSETLEKMVSFKRLFQLKRGLVVMNGFFEWIEEEGRKQPYFFCRKDKKLFAVASMWDVWESPAREIIHSCCMITTPPNNFLQPFHDRMPAILSEEAQKIWLDTTQYEVNRLKDCLLPYTTDELMRYPVTTKVGSPYFKDKSTIEPLNKEKK